MRALRVLSICLVLAAAIKPAHCQEGKGIFIYRTSMAATQMEQIAASDQNFRRFDDINEPDHEYVARIARQVLRCDWVAVRGNAMMETAADIAIDWQTSDFFDALRAQYLDVYVYQKIENANLSVERNQLPALYSPGGSNSHPQGIIIIPTDCGLCHIRGAQVGQNTGLDNYLNWITSRNWRLIYSPTAIRDHLNENVYRGRPVCGIAPVCDDSQFPHDRFKAPAAYVMPRVYWRTPRHGQNSHSIAGLSATSINVWHDPPHTKPLVPIGQIEIGNGSVSFNTFEGIMWNLRGNRNIRGIGLYVMDSLDVNEAQAFRNLTRWSQ